LPVFIIIIAILAGATFYSDSAKPGEPLYGFDTAVEKLWETFTLDPADQAKVRVGFADERMREIEILRIQAKVTEMNTAIIGLETNLRDAVDSAKKVGRDKNEASVDLVDEKIAAAKEVVNNLRSAGTPAVGEDRFLEDVTDFLDIERSRLGAELMQTREAPSKLSTHSQNALAEASESGALVQELEVLAKDELDASKSQVIKSLVEVVKAQEKLFNEQNKSIEKEIIRLNNP
jgi:hypothetical protein